MSTDTQLARTDCFVWICSVWNVCTWQPTLLIRHQFLWHTNISYWNPINFWHVCIVIVLTHQAVTTWLLVTNHPLLAKTRNYQSEAATHRWSYLSPDLTTRWRAYRHWQPGALNGRRSLTRSSHVSQQLFLGEDVRLNVVDIDTAAASAATYDFLFNLLKGEGVR